MGGRARQSKIYRRFAKDLVCLLERAHFAFQSLHLLGVFGRDPATVACINLNLLDPFVQKLRRTADVRRDRQDYRPPAVMLPLIVQNQPYSAFAHFWGILVCGLVHDAPSYS